MARSGRGATHGFTARWAAHRANAVAVVELRGEACVSGLQICFGWPRLDGLVGRGVVSARQHRLACASKLGRV
jgi:hypothetical protein